MPQVFTTSPDKANAAVDPVSPLVPEKEVLNQETNDANIPPLLKRPDETIVTPSFPQKSFIESKLPSVAEGIDNKRNLDPEFEKWFNDQVAPRPEEIALGKQAIEDKKKRFSDMITKFNQENTKAGKDAAETPQRVGKQALGGVLDFADSAMNSVISLANTSRRFFGVDDLSKVSPSAHELLPEPQTPGEHFVRSAAKFMTGMLPITGAVKGLTGIQGVANAVSSAGIYGFLFEDDKANSVVRDFVSDNVDLAAPVLDYLNHKTDDNEFVTRLKNGANYALDTAAIEGVFHGLKYARNAWAARDGAFKILENGDIQVNAKTVGTSDVSPAPESLFDKIRNISPEDIQVKGLSTEDVGKGGKKSTTPLTDALTEEINKVKELAKTKQDAVEGKLSQTRKQAMEHINQNPISVSDVLQKGENAPINNIDVMQAEIVRKGLENTVARVVEDYKAGKESDVSALMKIKQLAKAMEKTTYPRSTAGRALESAKFISNLDSELPSKENVKKMTDLFGNDAKGFMQEMVNMKDGKVGLPLVDTALKAIQQGNGSLKIATNMLQAARINWMLSDPTTHMTNILSTGANLPLRAATIKTAEVISKARSLVPTYGDRYLAIGVQNGEARAAIRGYFKGLNAVTKTIVGNINTLVQSKSLSSPDYKAIFAQDSNTKYNLALDQQIQDMTEAQNIQKASTVKQAAYYLGHIFAGTPVGKLLSYEDDIFKGIVYHSEIERQIHVMEMQSAYMVKSMQNAGASPEAIDAFMGDEMKKFDEVRTKMRNGEIPPEIEQTAVAEANKWTYNGSIDGMDPLSKLLRLGEQARDTLPVIGRWFVPFYRTGANIINQTLDYTPVLGTMAKSGNFGGLKGLVKGGREADMFLAKQAIGGTVMASAAALYATLEDNYGPDFEMTSLKNNKLGIKLGKFSLAIDKQNPIAKIIFASRDVMDIAQVAKEPEGAQAAAMASAALLAELYSPEQLVSTMNALTELTKGDRDKIPAAFESLLKTTLQSTITPYSGAANFINKDILGSDKVNFGSEDDGALGLLDEMMGRFKQTYLGNESGLPKRRGLFGQEIPYLRTFEFDVSDNAHDMFAGYNENHPVVKEIMRLTRQDAMVNPANYDEYQANNTTFLQMPGKTLSLPTTSLVGDVHKMSPKEYSDYVKYSAGEGMNVTLEDALKKLIASEKYQGLKSDTFKMKEINLIIRAYRTIGKAQLFKDDPAILQEAQKAAELIKGVL